MNKTILFMDNDPAFLDVQARLLEQAGYIVLQATSVREADEKLQERYIHLAILDIRMEDEDDPQDISGLTLVQNERYQYIPKIILTSYPSWFYAEKALGVALTGKLVKMLDKTDGPQAILKAVEEGFGHYLNINWSLAIRWSERELISMPHLVTLVDHNDHNGASLKQRVNEFEDLLRRLFHKSHQIIVSRLFCYVEGRVFLGIQAYAESGIEKQYLVACGQKKQIEVERERYKAHIPATAGFGSLSLIREVETAHFAATAYTLNDGNLEEVTTLAEFYRQRDIEAIIEALNNLFTKTLKSWHEEGWFQTDVKTPAVFLAQVAMPDVEILARHIEALCQEVVRSRLAQRIDYSPGRLTVYLPERESLSLPNPVTCLTGEWTTFSQPLLCGTTHGRLNGNNILVDKKGTAWLVDFSDVRLAPLLKDFTLLEMAIRFELLNVFDALAVYEMECRLVEVTRLDEEADYGGLGDELEKAIRTINYVRQLCTAVNDGEIQLYLGGLLYCTLAQLTEYYAGVRHTRQEIFPYFHRLLLAAILCRKLMPVPRVRLPEQAMHSLWLDLANREAWVEGQLVALTVQDFDLLYCLYHREGQLCSRRVIAEEVFGVEYRPGMSEQEQSDIEEIESGRINAAISRLRQKIATHSSGRKYIIAVRGEGYRLDLGRFAAENHDQ